MSRMFTVETVPYQRMDRSLLLAILLLSGIGLTMLFSVSYPRAEALFQNPLYFFKRQSVLMGLGAAGAILFARINLRLVERWIPVVVILNIVLLSLTFLPQFGAKYLGAQRWIMLFGYSFQPSELVKFCLVLYLAFLLGRKQDRFDDPVNSLLPPMVVTALIVFMVYLQNDLSTAVLILSIAAAMFFAAGVRIRYFISLCIMSLPLLSMLVLSREHRVNRILTYLEPNMDPSGAGYQALMSRTALRTGGIWGQGIGMGEYKFGLLPEAHSDFLFAIVGEELGFIGVVLVMLLFLYLGYRGYITARRGGSGFVRLAAAGLSIAIVFQGLMNMAVVAGAVPATGITLPFFSSGGTSVMVTLWMCGMLLNLSRYTNEEDLDPVGVHRRQYG